jgi:hypothetical protein
MGVTVGGLRFYLRRSTVRWKGGTQVSHVVRDLARRKDAASVKRAASVAQAVTTY